MHSCLDSLPYDLLFEISLYLNVEDVINLHNSCRQLRFLVGEETLCRKLLEVNHHLVLRDHPTDPARIVPASH
jgi:hypothetical protein